MIYFQYVWGWLWIETCLIFPSSPLLLGLFGDFTTWRGELSYWQTLNYIYPCVEWTLFLPPPKAAWTSTRSSEVDGIFAGFDGPDGQSFFCCCVWPLKVAPMNLCSLINFIAFNNWLSTEMLLNGRDGGRFYEILLMDGGCPFSQEMDSTEESERQIFIRGPLEQKLIWIELEFGMTLKWYRSPWWVEWWTFRCGQVNLSGKPLRQQDDGRVIEMRIASLFHQRQIGMMIPWIINRFQVICK